MGGMGDMDGTGRMGGSKPAAARRRSEKRRRRNGHLIAKLLRFKSKDRGTFYISTDAHSTLGNLRADGEPEEDQVPAPESGRDEAHTCATCGGGDDEGTLRTCDVCDNNYHCGPHCHFPPIEGPIEGDWL